MRIQVRSDRAYQTVVHICNKIVPTHGCNFKKNGNFSIKGKVNDWGALLTFRLYNFANEKNLMNLKRRVQVPCFLHLIYLFWYFPVAVTSTLLYAIEGILCF